MSGRRLQIVRLNSSGASMQLDPQTAFLYVPHTISVLLLGLALLAYHGRVFSPLQQPGDGDLVAAASASNAEAGVWAAILVFLGYAVVQGPRTSMVRPHPAVWRLVHGVLVVYVLFLVWMLFQDVHDARQFLKHLSPSLGVEVDSRTYAADCRLWLPGRGPNWAVIRDTLFDEFVVAHTVGWWAKALAVRNQLLLWTVSIAFELMELTFSHMLPNFNECWWDSWILDVAICNFVGIVVGMWTVRFFECRYEHYNWQGLSQLPGLKAKAQRSVQQLLPHTWTKFNWMVFASPKRFMLSLAVVAVMLAFEVNVFFLKYALWIPPTNPLNTYRLLLWFLCALPGIREYYEFMEAVCPQRNAAAAAAEQRLFTKLGVFAWLAIAMTCLETMISIKFGKGLYPAPWPKRVVGFWACTGAAFTAFMVAWVLRVWLQQRRRVVAQSFGTLPASQAAAATGAMENGSATQLDTPVKQKGA